MYLSFVRLLALGHAKLSRATCTKYSNAAMDNYLRRAAARIVKSL